ncbi:DsrE family protein [Marinitoga sp. 38H-ov]|uniref:DsrE family protein n=1 Tax=Marinitoga sp. 38H-ov TaxID=1755814 RepID=UPI0013EB8101|nr:DsrE family protein [Marinitoga sp. 38H-ov]KAF2955293.1 hypothetical protein AS160_10775 [Marinitoga sp. 38H-ov]
MDKLAVLWTTENEETFSKMIFPYVYNSKKKGWFDEVVLIIWGPSQLKAIEKFSDDIKKLIDINVIVEACKWCSDQYNISNELEELGINVRYTGEPLTHYLKNNYKVLSI